MIKPSPLVKGLLVRALILAAVFAVAHLAGLRQYTSILCGMAPAAGDGSHVFALFGLLYVLFYLAFTVIVPVLLLAAGLIQVWERWRRHE